MNNLRYLIYNSPVGPITIVGDETNITQIKFGGKANVRKHEKIYQHITMCHDQLAEYFLGKRASFDLPIQQFGTDFQKAVWSKLRRIPYGDTKTYGQIAKDLGDPNKARAVGGACNKNELLIIVPCHRVVGLKGPTGFAAGLDVKECLLKHERPS